MDCDVLIVGGGPTGVTLAVLLAQHGVSVVVAEKEAAIYPLPRAAHLDHEVLRIVQQAGAASFSATTTDTPRCASSTASVTPVGPPPTIKTSQSTRSALRHHSAFDMAKLVDLAAHYIAGL